MNYGKESLSKKKKNVSSKKNMKKKRVGVRVFKAVVICFLLICIIGAVGGGLFVKKIIDDAPEITPASVKPSGYKSQVVAASNGQNLGQFREAGSNRIYKTIDTIPKYLANAFVAIEDERFYEHNGIDLQGIHASLAGRGKSNLLSVRTPYRMSVVCRISGELSTSLAIVPRFPA